jgi:transposase-like protein
MNSNLPNHLNSKSRRYSPAEKKQILEEVENGLSVAGAARKYSVHHSTIGKWRLMEKKELRKDTQSDFENFQNKYRKNCLI